MLSKLITIKTLVFFALLVAVSLVCHAATPRDPFSLEQRNTSLSSTVIPIHYANAEALETFLTKNRAGLLSAQGHVQADARTNQLWIYDDPSHIHQILTLIHKLDVPVAQVLIKARLVSVDDNYVRSLGVIFGSKLSQTQQDGEYSMDMPNVTEGAGMIDLPIAKLGNGELLDLQLTALEQEGHAEVISSPELIASNRQPATIESGEEVPYQEKTGQGNTSVAFKKATLRLQVTPELRPGKRILLHLAVNQDKISGLLVNGVPAIVTQQLTTEVVLQNQETVVLGGIYEQTISRQEEGVPVLRKIPILGALFRQRRRINERKQLLIFVTPQVIH